MPGHSKEILKDGPPDRKFLCVSCDLILNDAVQTYCGHRYCRCCVDDILSKPGPHVCVACPEKDPDSLITAAQVFPDNAIKRELKSINVMCINGGCDWEGFFRDYEEHISRCAFALIVCMRTGCDQKIQRRHLANHLETECLMRVLVCDFCKDEVFFKDRKKHEDLCPEFLIICDFCGKSNIPRKKYADHIDAVKGDCKRKVAPCTYKEVGCRAMVEVEKMNSHMKEAETDHIHLIFMKLMLVEPILKEIKGIDVRGVTAKVFENGAKIESIEKVLKEIENKIARLLKEGPHVKIKTGKAGPKGLDASMDAVTKTIEELVNKIAVLETKVTTYEGIIAVLNSQIERDAQVVQTLERQMRQDRELLQALERKIKAQDRIIALKDVALAEQDLRIQSLEMASYDGVLVWRISNFNQKRQDAISGRTTSIYSPCFYTSRHGYKMCARIYINGDGMGKGNHVSLFFVIMKGPFDALLRWPFRQKVTFMLLDQNNREHVIDAFRPDPTSTSFKRPANDMNIASGCPLFMPISQLDSSRHAYVRDDALFLKVIVDISDIA